MNSRTGPPGPPETVHSPGGVGRPILSQSEDQSRPHPVLTFVHPMSTQIRSPGPGAAESAHRSDPQTATRTRTRPANRQQNIQKTAYNHPNPRHERPGTPTPANQPRPARAICQDAAVVPCRLMPARHSSATRQAEMTSTVDTAVTISCLSTLPTGYGGVVLS